MKLEFFKKSKKSAKKSFKPRAAVGEQALHDWWIMVAVFVALVLVVAGFDLYFFMRINAGGFFTADGQVQDNETVLTKKALLDAQNFYSAREKEYQAFVSVQPAEIDPSI